MFNCVSFTFNSFFGFSFSGSSFATLDPLVGTGSKDSFFSDPINGFEFSGAFPRFEDVPGSEGGVALDPLPPIPGDCVSASDFDFSLSMIAFLSCLFFT